MYIPAIKTRLAEIGSTRSDWNPKDAGRINPAVMKMWLAIRSIKAYYIAALELETDR